ncbi:MAG: HDOD domain-containing protein, partial [Planctomycetota bacterium]|nr:HDOD domain-containing protein [Planctomycetota bacterium]
MAYTVRDDSLLDRIVKSNRLPSCPAIMVSLIRALHMPETSTSDLAQLISADTSLTVRVLRMVNSAFYGLPRQIRSVDEAALRLGFREISSLVVGLQMNDMFRSIGDITVDGESLWHHSLKVGVAAKRLSRATRVHNPHEQFTAGILHDVGKLALCVFDGHAALRFYADSSAGPQHQLERERVLWGLDHAELGANLLRKWEMPEELALLVERHHRLPNTDKAELQLNLADALAHAIKRERSNGQDLLRVDFTGNVLNPGVCEAFGLELSDLVPVANDTAKEFQGFLRT